MWNPKGNDTSELIYKIATDSQTERTNMICWLPWWLPRRWMRGQDSWHLGIWDGHAHPAMFKMDNQQRYTV